jgi:hypothetical protein
MPPLVNEQAFSRLDECEIIAGLRAAFLNPRAEL